MKLPIWSYNVIQQQYNKQYSYLNAGSFIIVDKNVSFYCSTIVSSSEYNGINSYLRCFNNSNIYITNSQYYYIGVDQRYMGQGFKQGSVSLTINSNPYIDLGDGILRQSGSSVNVGNIFYKSGDIIITNTKQIVYLKNNS